MGSAPFSLGAHPMTKGRNPYRSGTASYARFRKGALRRKSALAQATAARAKTPGTGQRAKQRASAAQRALRAIETREEFRSKLSEPDRDSFSQMPITRQERLMKIQ